MKVIVTGNQGYLGGVVAPALAARGHEVVGIDSGLFSDCLFTPSSDVATLRCDIRDVDLDALRGAEVVIHLAALSNDPIGNLDAELTRQINLAATVRLGELAKRAGVRRLVFASSCIMYGAAEGGVVDETTPLEPQTEYARSKVAGELELSHLADDGFSPVYLRNGTVYGAAPRMRLDTVFNEFLATAVQTGTVVVRGDGQAWRPVVDIRDVAMAFVAAAEAPAEDVHDEAFNIGAAHLNHRIADLAEIAASLVDGGKVEILSEPSSDRRSYQADFGKCGRVFPQLRFRPVQEGGRDLVDAFFSFGGVDLGQQRQRFVRLERLNHLLKDGRLAPSLRWNEAS